MQLCLSRKILEFSAFNFSDQATFLQNTQIKIYIYTHMYITEQFILCVITGIASIKVLLYRKGRSFNKL